MSATVMQAKMKVDSVTLVDGGEILKMAPVTNGTAEDNSFSEYTPSGSLELFITNPDLAGKFKPAQTYYVNFTEAD